MRGAASDARAPLKAEWQGSTQVGQPRTFTRRCLRSEHGPIDLWTEFAESVVSGLRAAEPHKPAIPPCVH